MLKSLSVVIPVYNELENIPTVLDELLSYIPNIAQMYEIIVVNDGSTDCSDVILNEYTTRFPVVRVIHQDNQGFGGAINTGLINAQYEWIFYTDADKQFNLIELSEFIEYARHYDMILGYRISRAEGIRRWILALGMKYWNFFVLGMPLTIQDIDCAFKLMRRSVVQKSLPLVSRGNIVTTELLIRAINEHTRIKQIGVTHYKRQFGISKCGGIKDVIRVIFETFVLYRSLYFGNSRYSVSEA